MPMFKKAAIIGTGLIGGSLAMALKKKKLCRQVVGVCRHESSAKKAVASGVLDEGSTSLGVVNGADLVVLAAPVQMIIETGEQLVPLVPAGALVTDVGSTKKQIVQSLQKLFPNFVGSHPIAGSEKRGSAWADADLFKGNLCVLTPTPHTNPVALAAARKMWLGVGAKVAVMPLPYHDRVFGYASHLAHAAAFSLIASIPEEYAKFSGGGLKDTTRIAASDPEVWADIFISNAVNVLPALDGYAKKCGQLRALIAQKDKKKLIRFLAQAQQRRLGI
jgi:prephenate dehydrogenase